MYVHHTHTWCPRRLEGGIRSLGIVARWVWATMYTLGSESKASGKSASTFNHWALYLSGTPQDAFQVLWGWRDRSDWEGTREQGGDTHRHFSAQCRSCSCRWSLTFCTHHCVVKPCWDEVIQARGVNEASIIVKEAPEYQKYKLEGNTKVLLLDLFFIGGF